MSKKFKNLKTGNIYETSNKEVIEQYEKYTELYAPIGNIKEPTYAELKAKAKEMGLEFKSNIKKDDLVALIKSVE